MGRSQKELFRKIVAGKYEFKEEDWEDVSDDAKDLVKKMLVLNPDERISAEERSETSLAQAVEGSSQHDCPAGNFSEIEDVQRQDEVAIGNDCRRLDQQSQTSVMDVVSKSDFEWLFWGLLPRARTVRWRLVPIGSEN